MKSVSKSRNGILVTGSSGFIGKHLCTELSKREGSPPETREANVLDRAGLKALARTWKVTNVIHLAGAGRVVAPVSLAPVMFSTAIEGTLNVVESFAPRVLFIASTCAVYGTTEDCGAVAGKTALSPIGLYGISRTSCERLATSWAAESGNTAIILRFGNVIGSGCGGLIPYLVDHAVRHPDASVPARLRGAGQIIRDYVPVSHIVKVLSLAASESWEGVKEQFFNLGTGRGKANGEIARIVTEMLSELGYKLTVQYSEEPGPGESRQAILDVESTSERFGVTPPCNEAVRETIATAVYDRLAQQTERSQSAAAR